MTTESGKVIRCHQCKTNACVDRYPQGVPDYCQAREFLDVIEQTKEEYFKPEVAKIHLACAKVDVRGDYQWPRVKEAIEFARELGVTKVGLAVCISQLREGREFARFLTRAGLDVYSVACMIGAVDCKDTGLPEEWCNRFGIACNPIAQAEILNRQGTGLNFVYGLCMGHDTMFCMYSKAPVTFVTVKDRVTGNNPSAVLYSTYHRMRLWSEYGESHPS